MYVTSKSVDKCRRVAYDSTCHGGALRFEGKPRRDPPRTCVHKRISCIIVCARAEWKEMKKRIYRLNVNMIKIRASSGWREPKNSPLPPPASLSRRRDAPTWRWDLLMARGFAESSIDIERVSRLSIGSFRCSKSSALLADAFSPFRT